MYSFFGPFGWLCLKNLHRSCHPPFLYLLIVTPTSPLYISCVTFVLLFSLQHLPLLPRVPSPAFCFKQIQTWTPSLRSPIMSCLEFDVSKEVRVNKFQFHIYTLPYIYSLLINSSKLESTIISLFLAPCVCIGTLTLVVFVTLFCWSPPSAYFEHTHI